MSTNVVLLKDIKRSWHLIDAANQPLGRLASQLAQILIGKNKVNYVPYLDMGDYVVVTNASLIKVTGKKGQQKKYFRHSGYPGGDKVETFDQLKSRKPEKIIEIAVKGMLPKNKLSSKMLKKLHVFSGSEHTYKKELGEIQNGK